MQQKTLNAGVELNGFGVHSGKNVTITLHPMDVYSGVAFHRTDLENATSIKASYDNVTDTMMSTTIGSGQNSLSTIEHLMAALHGSGITNCLIKCNNKEIPIMDGSALNFCKEINSVGIKNQNQLAKYVKVIKKIIVGDKNSWIELSPSSERLISMHFDFYGKISEKLLPHKKFVFNLDKDDFSKVIAHARTFGLYEDAEKLRSMGLAKGANLNNTVVIKENYFMNENGLRDENELVKHKILDAIGDLALSPYPIVAHYSGYNTSHTLNNKLLHALFSDPETFEVVE